MTPGMLLLWVVFAIASAILGVVLRCINHRVWFWLHYGRRYEWSRDDRAGLYIPPGVATGFIPVGAAILIMFPIGFVGSWVSLFCGLPWGASVFPAMMIPPAVYVLVMLLPIQDIFSDVNRDLPGLRGRREKRAENMRLLSERIASEGEPQSLAGLYRRYWLAAWRVESHTALVELKRAGKARKQDEVLRAKIAKETAAVEQVLGDLNAILQSPFSDEHLRRKAEAAKKRCLEMLLGPFELGCLVVFYVIACVVCAIPALILGGNLALGNSAGVIFWRGKPVVVAWAVLVLLSTPFLVYWVLQRKCFARETRKLLFPLWLRVVLAGVLLFFMGPVSLVLMLSSFARADDIGKEWGGVEPVIVLSVGYLVLCFFLFLAAIMARPRAQHRGGSVQGPGSVSP